MKPIDGNAQISQSSANLVSVTIRTCECVNDPVAMKLLGKAGEMGSLESPDDESIKTLYVGGLNSRILEKSNLSESWLTKPAFVTYTTREGAWKAAQELSNRLVVNGQRLKLMWGRPETLFDESDIQSFVT